jgi:hypothetical protein
MKYTPWTCVLKSWSLTGSTILGVSGNFSWGPVGGKVTGDMPMKIINGPQSLPFFLLPVQGEVTSLLFHMSAAMMFCLTTSTESMGPRIMD